VDLSAVETVVLDEADRMLDMGFIKPMERILGQVPKTRQTLLFSATFSDGIRKLAQRFLRSPEVIEVARNNSAAESVAQEAHWVDRGRKRELLSHLIGANNWRQVLVFTRTKRGADRLALQLSQDGIDAMAIHGDKSQGQRTRALAAFKRQGVRALVATDVAARGIDIDRLPHVVNYELPDNAEDYVHRIGRTGRGGQRGCAVSLVAGDERGQFTAIQQLVKGNLQATVVPGFEPTQGSDRAPHPEARRGKPRPSAPRAPRKGFAPKGAPRNGGQKPGRRASRKSV
jgi:ATP-dependent RNA helicase RhlE